MNKIFICYSQKDEKYKDDVCDFLRRYKHDLDIWSDGRIDLGQDWEAEIMKSLEDCDAAIMLISNSFLISKFITEIEIPKLLHRRATESIPIFPFILRSCNWSTMMDLGKIQAHPKKGKPYQSFIGHNRIEVLNIFSKKVFDSLVRNEVSIVSKESKAEVEKSSFSIDKNLSLVEQLDQFFTHKFGSIKSLSSEYFLNEYPFKNGFKNATTRRNFVLFLNKELSELFDSFKISKNGILQNTFTNINEYNCANRVLVSLKENCITHVSSLEKRKVKKVSVSHEIDKFKPLDYYDKFNFKDAFENLPKINENDDLNTNIQKGYFLYSIGEYVEASKHFKKALESAQKEKNPIKTYICSHNLYHLGRLIEFNFWNLPNKTEIVEDLKSVELDRLLNDLEINTGLKKLWKDDFFFKDADKIIKRESAKIVDKYYSYLEGGRSSDNFNYEIFYQYALLNSFLSNNHIIYDNYYEYKETIHHLIESIFASYSIRNGNAKIEHINDFLLWHILKYSDLSVLEKIAKRYSILKIDYAENKTEFNFVQLFANLFSTSNKDIEKYISFLTQDNQGSFRLRIESERNKFLFLMGKLNLQTRKCNKVTRIILDFINNDLPNVKRSVLNRKYIYSFFINQAPKITKKNINMFIISVYRINQMYDMNYLSQFLKVCERNNIPIKIEQKVFNKYILTHLKSNLEKESRISEEELSIELFPFLNNNQQIIFKEIYLKKLHSEFNFQLFYVLVVYKIIPYNYENHIWNYINQIDISKFVNNHFSYFFNLSKVKRYADVDRTLNILFMNEIDLGLPEVQRFATINNYYKWILNLENYDYADFDPYWIDEYQTTYYLEHFRRSDHLRKRLRSYLENTIDRRIEKLYDKIYCN